jgi:hypothetical protein
LDRAVKIAHALGDSLDWLCDLLPRTLGQLTLDEYELLAAYRAIGNPESKKFILRIVKQTPK